MTYVFKFFKITLWFLSVTDWDSPYRDLGKIVGKPHSHHVIFTTLSQNRTMLVPCPCGIPAIISEPKSIFLAKMTI